MEEQNLSRALEGKNVIVIGAAGGTGSGFAKYFASQGANILCNDAGFAMMEQGGDFDVTRPSHDEADRITAEIRAMGGTAEADYHDASDWNNSKAIVEHCMDAFGSCDVVVHASVISRLGMIDEMTEENWNLVLRHNLNTSFFITHHSLPYMKKQNYGRHIFIMSATVRDMWCGANFAAATGGRYSFMRDLALEVKDYNITANAIQPYTQTKTGQRPDGQKMLEARSKALGIPLRKDFNDTLLPPGETNAPLGAYLCTDEGRVFNGQYFDNHLGRICIWSTMLEQRYIYKDIEKDGYWTVDELREIMPAALLPAASKLFYERV